MGHSIEEVKELLSKNLSSFIPFLVFQTFIQLISAGAEFAGILPGSGPDIWVQLLISLLTVWNLCYLVQITKSIKENKEAEFTEQVLDATYDSFSFFLYSLLYGLTVGLGGLLFLIPGIYCLIFHYFAPYKAILGPTSIEESNLSYSRKIVKPYWGQVVGFLVILVILNMIVFGVLALPFLGEFRLVLRFLFAPLDGLLLLISNLLAISFYHFLSSEYQKKLETSL